MISEFKTLDCTGAKSIAKAIDFCPSKFCDFTPFVILMWQKMYKTEYILNDDGLFLKLFIDGSVHYAISSPDIKKAVVTLSNIVNEKTLSLSLVDEKSLGELKENFKIKDIITKDEWWDYLYLHSDLSELKGKRFAGQRNHINKFKESFPNWSYEEVNEENLKELYSFYLELIKDTPLFDSALFESEMVKEYLKSGYYCFKTKGGFIRAGGEIVSFAFGETVGDTLFVHIEKARRDIQGAYQMIVKEFASHNGAEFVNREEDMGIEGLKRSKESYHPIEKLKKYSLNIDV